MTLRDTYLVTYHPKIVLMPNFIKKPCRHCQKIFQPSKTTHDFCCDGCRTKSHREQNNIEEPSFLSSPKKPKEYSIVGEDIAVPSAVVIQPVQPTTNVNFGDIGITAYFANPEYVKAVKDYQACTKNTRFLIEKSEKSTSEIYRLEGKAAKMQGILLGGLATLGLGFTTIYFNAKNTNPLWYLLLIPAVIVGAIAGAALSVAAFFGSEKAVKLVEVAQKKEELLQLDKEIEVSKSLEKEIIIQRDAVQKQIAKYDIVTKNENYTEFQEVTGANAISLESLKNKHFKTLAFLDKWKELVGTPEANFCMMVYGKPGHGKSYFTLEFSEYLASNFGMILFNSSEEGASLSLKNKIVNFKMDNIYLGNAMNLNSLQVLLAQSAYKFVIIDSINHMNITAEDLRKLRGLHPTKAFICILQATKSGDFKGSNEFEHDADISIKIEDRKSECMKTRYK